MTETPFQKLLELVAFDQSLVLKEKQLNELKVQIHKEKQEVETLQEQIQAKKIEKDETQKAVDSKELEMQSLIASQAEKEKKLDAVSGHKEYKAIMHEIDLLKKNQHDFEEELLAAWKDLESIKRIYEEKKIEISKKIETLQKSISEKQHELNDLEAKLSELTTLRPAKIEGVPEEWLEKYAMMRASVSDPVVPVENNACSACFYSITQQDLSGLRRRQLLQCKDCFRFLYLKEMHEAA